ncbi:MAG: glycosyltransferase family 4 protein [Bryobacteraceae bacterium]|jgi:glycosyltransferase involved in cell wall biosynthesis
MKIAIVVHGRFHAFDLAVALSRRHQVTVFTNYPKWACKRFGLAPAQVRSFWLHGIVSRAAWWLHENLSIPYAEAFLHKLFGRWAAARIVKEEWDVVHSFSGVSEEILRATSAHASLRMMVRASAHIRAQARIMEDEELRAGTRLDRPSRWMIAREEREYSLAERIYVLSSFARNSFLGNGTAPWKLSVVPHGARLDHFRPPDRVIEARCDRIVSGQPLRVLFVGTLCFRKGLLDLAAILRAPGSERFQFRFVGPVSEEARRLVKELHPLAEFVPKQPQDKLSESYAWGDVFVFPTIEDGFALVLTQANAAGLPILTTTNCCGPDLIHEGKTGWVLPIRAPEAFTLRLDWCHAHREELAGMVRRIYYDFQPRTWADVATDFEAVCEQHAVID